ncbi:hypothetical protein roselon_00503 [Roseibacterium elongatum DSM 19469]|uniref:DUF4329 domain-containing protein n=1 Tax=Roseicyclus elongatus DSM 19469 TaxID=1294273 RepID=W8RP87_9RHOB|nr:DUF4329 domain-containing protein [Roseibacterium elongatum]AHM02944.1 hypothetical protein roselon_00503 [Roseibacterium elongatum DSM 19469]
MRRLATLALAAAMALPVPMAATAQSEAETEFMMGLMEAMNQLSVRFNREVCGFVLVDDAGNFSSTKVSWGGHASCASLPLQQGATVVSSWHTHAAWARQYDNEVPSIQDVEGDMRMGVNGWVGTPGGRLWFVHGRSGTIRQVCGPDCLPSDPASVNEVHSAPNQTYTLDGLYARFGRSR